MARHQSAKSKVELPIGVIAQLAMAFPLPLLSTDNRASWWKMPFSQFPFRVNEKANFENFLIKKWQNKKPSDWKCEGRGSCTILVIINNNSAGGLSPSGLMTLPTAGLTSVELKCLLSAVYCRRGNCSPPFSPSICKATLNWPTNREKGSRELRRFAFQRWWSWWLIWCTRQFLIRFRWSPFSGHSLDYWPIDFQWLPIACSINRND